MGYNRDNYKRIRYDYEGKNLKAKEEAVKRTNELYDILPELKDIDDHIKDIGLKLFAEGLKGREGFEERVAEIRKGHLEALEARADLLEYSNYPAGYTDVKYECAECSDTGFIGIDMCSCMKRALVMAGYESSGVGNLIRTQSFETFNLDYYNDISEWRREMEENLQEFKNYAKNFKIETHVNLLLMGATGLGKTHISTSIAKVVIENGFDVVYDTAQNIFGDFEFERFNRTYQDDSEDRTEKYFECDLLIIDDLGTEVNNQFTVSTLYNIINTRVNNNKSIIINTNLTRDELRKKYADRIASRLFGEFLPKMFYGKDVRELKLK
ncbi:MAG: ATP-binding protein [Oscillospiraceae bacterium]|nr:ATP-binding protein [Oscillospiraceae bacterium]